MLARCGRLCRHDERIVRVGTRSANASGPAGLVSLTRGAYGPRSWNPPSSDQVRTRRWPLTTAPREPAGRVEDQASDGGPVHGKDIISHE